MQIRRLSSGKSVICKRKKFMWRLQRWECSDRQGRSVLDSGDIGEQSRQAYTAPAEECEASAVHRGAAVTELYLPVPEIRRAVAFNTRCSSSVIVFGDEARTELQ